MGPVSGAAACWSRLAVLAVLAVLACVQAAPVFVAPNGQDLAACGQRSSPCSVAAGLRAAAVAGSPVMVLPGTYTGCPAGGHSVDFAFSVSGLPASNGQVPTFSCPGGAFRIQSERAAISALVFQQTAPQGQPAVNITCSAADCVVALENVVFDGRGAGGGLVLETSPQSQTVAVQLSDGVFQNVQTTEGAAVYVALRADDLDSLTVNVTGSRFTMDAGATSGGGLEVHNFGTANDLLVSVADSRFEGNDGGRLGAALGLSHDGPLENSHIAVRNTAFVNNRATITAGLLINYHDSVSNIRHVIEGCQFEGNTAGFGAALQFFHNKSVASSATTVRDCVFEGNSAQIGGAVNVWYFAGTSACTIEVTNSSFVRNTAQFCGGGVSVLSTRALDNVTYTFTDTVFQGNTAEVGGGLCVAATDVLRTRIRVQRSSFTSNRARSYGGAVAFAPTISSPNISSEIFGDQEYIWVDSALSFEETEFSHNEATFGGALHLDVQKFETSQSHPMFVLDSVAVTSNRARELGGGLWIAARIFGNDQVSYADIEDCRRNDTGSRVLVQDSSFKHNTAASSGGGLFVQGTMTSLFRGTEFVLNLANSSGAALFANGENTPACVSLSNATVVSDNHEVPGVQVEFVSLLDVDRSELRCPAGNVQNNAQRIEASRVIFDAAEGFEDISRFARTISTSAFTWRMACEECSTDFYAGCAGSAVDLNASLVNVCKACPPGATCPGGRIVNTTPGFWLCHSECEVETFECPEGFCGSNNECMAGRRPARTNVLCGECLPGFTRVGHECRQCKGKEGRSWIYVLLGSWVWVLFLMYLCRTQHAASKKILIYFVQTLRLLLGPLSGWAPWLSIFNLDFTRYFCLGATKDSGVITVRLVTPLIYVLLLCVSWLGYAVYRLRKSQFHFVVTEESRDTVRVSVHERSGTFSSLKQLLLSDIGGSEVPNNVTEEKAEDYALAVSYQEFKAPPTLINWVDENEQDMQLTEALKEKRVNYLRRKYMFVRTFQFIMLFSFETLTEQAMQLVNCVRVCHFGRRVVEFPSLLCGSEAYTPFFAVALVLLVYAAMFPLGLFMWLRRHRDSLFDVDRLALWGIFYDHYHHRVYWWQVQELVRRLAIVAVYVGLFTKPLHRSYWLWVLCQIVLLMQLSFQPFHSTVDNALETASLFLLTYVAGTQVAYGGQYNATVEAMHVIVLIWLGCIGLAFVREFAVRHKHRVGSWRMVDSVSWWWASRGGPAMANMLPRRHRYRSEGEEYGAGGDLGDVDPDGGAGRGGGVPMQTMSTGFGGITTNMLLST